MKGLLKVAVAVVTVLAAAPAFAGHGDHDRYCGIMPTQDWKNPQDIIAQAKQDGYEVIDLHVKHGCWKIEAIDRTHHRVDVVYDPTGKLLWIDED